jgi:hypothetical protein
LVLVSAGADATHLVLGHVANDVLRYPVCVDRLGADRARCDDRVYDWAVMGSVALPLPFHEGMSVEPAADRDHGTKGCAARRPAWQDA